MLDVKTVGASEVENVAVEPAITPADGRQVLSLTLRPHIERDRCLTDRFDVYLGEALICTSRSGWHTPARELLRRGYSPATLMRVQHEGRVFDPTIVPKPIGEVAK
jgi:hypothetical protein